MRDWIAGAFCVGPRSYPGFAYVESFRQLGRVYHFYFRLIHGRSLKKRMKNSTLIARRRNRVGRFYSAATWSRTFARGFSGWSIVFARHQRELGFDDGEAGIVDGVGFIIGSVISYTLDDLIRLVTSRQRSQFSALHDTSRQDGVRSPENLPEPESLARDNARRFRGAHERQMARCIFCL
jgi:hypothetical protein